MEERGGITDQLELAKLVRSHSRCDDCVEAIENRNCNVPTSQRMVEDGVERCSGTGSEIDWYVDRAKEIVDQTVQENVCDVESGSEQLLQVSVIDEGDTDGFGEICISMEIWQLEYSATETAMRSMSEEHAERLPLTCKSSSAAAVEMHGYKELTVELEGILVMVGGSGIATKPNPMRILDERNPVAPPTENGRSTCTRLSHR